VEVVASLSQGRTAAAQCGLFTYKSVPVIFEPPCSMTISKEMILTLGYKLQLNAFQFVGVSIRYRSLQLKHTQVWVPLELCKILINYQWQKRDRL